MVPHNQDPCLFWVNTILCEMGLSRNLASHCAIYELPTEHSLLEPKCGETSGDQL